MEFEPWSRNIDFVWSTVGCSKTVAVSVSVDEIFVSPIDLCLEDDDNFIRLAMSPDDTRELAAKLIEAADAADKAGRVR